MQTVELRVAALPELKPLIQLPGSLPEDWKEALYGE